MAQRHHLVPLGQMGFDPVQIDPAVFGERRDVDLDAQPLGHQLPGHDVRMMLQHGQHDPVAIAQICRAPALRDQIDRLGRAAHEHAFIRAGRPDKIRHGLPRGFIAQRHVRRAPIHAAMHRGIIRAIALRDRIDHGTRLLRGRGAIKIMPMLGQAGKIGTDIERRRFFRHQRAHRRFSSTSRALPSSASRAASSSMPIKASAMNACSIRPRATSGGRPRVAM